MSDELTARQALATGAFNDMSVETMSDGSQKITLTKRGVPFRYVLVVRNLYKADEEVLQDHKENI